MRSGHSEWERSFPRIRNDPSHEWERSFPLTVADTARVGVGERCSGLARKIGERLAQYERRRPARRFSTRTNVVVGPA